MASKDNYTKNKLQKEINNYLLRMIANDYAQGTVISYERVLKKFAAFADSHNMQWKNIFTSHTLSSFQRESNLKNISPAIKGLWRYLIKQNIIAQPIPSKRTVLPKIYEQYLEYYAKLHQVCPNQIIRVRGVLAALNLYLKIKHRPLSKLNIEALDSFFTEYDQRYTLETRQSNRSCLRGFLKYLFYERRIIKKDLSPMLRGAPLFANSRPPKFLRQNELQRLFAYSKKSLASAYELRAYAMLILAYTLGLRPKEISLITLDDISFNKAQINITQRKSSNPIKLPLPDEAIKAIAAYIVGGRPKSNQRALFFTLRAPYKQIAPLTVSINIANSMRKANINASAYSLRHTYAQNLMEQGVPIFDIKEMMGHDKIQTTQRYINIQPNLMRRIIFNENL